MDSGGQAIPLAAFVLGGLLLLVAGGVLADGDATVVLTDPQGDATEMNAGTAMSTATNACWAGSPATSTACIAAGDAAQPGSRVDETSEGHGTPAPPEVDILEVAVAEGPESVELVMTVARLDPVVLSEMERAPSWGIDWQAQADGCGEAVWMYLWPDGTPRAGLEHWDLGCLIEDRSEHPWAGECNDWGWCTEKIDVEIAMGSPGRITWTLPRASLIHGEAGDQLHAMTARTALGQRGDGDAVRWWVPIMDPVAAGGVVFTSMQGTADLTAVADPFPLEQAHTPAPRGEASSEREAFPAGQGVSAAIREDLDIVAFELIETPETVAMRAELSLVDVEPAEDAFLWFALGLPSGHVLEAAAEEEAGSWTGRAAMRAPGYGEPLRQYTLTVPVSLEVEPGRPGAVTLVFDRAELPFIPAGGRTNLFVLVAAPSGAANEVDQPVGPTKLWARVEDDAAGDYTDGSRPYVFLHDSPAPESLGTIVADDQGDAVLAPGARAGGADPDLFDITYLEIRPQSPSETRFTMGIRELAGMRVPLGYQAVYYAFGVETETGPQMIGYYKDADEPAGTFLCAPDATVLADEPTDPTTAVWTVIDGLLQVATGGPDGSGSGGPGSLTWIVPPECLGVEAGEDVSLPLVEAGTFLVANPTARTGEGQVEQADVASVPDGLSWSPTTPLASTASPGPLAGLLAGNAWYWWALRVAGLVGGPAMFVVGRRAKQRDKDAEQHAVYRSALEQSLRAGREPDIDDDVLVGLRKRFSISDRMHARILDQAHQGMGRLPSTLAPGSVFLDRYRVEAVLGEGGFGLTYLAHDETLDRKVVLKAARWESAREQKRALEEARILAQMGHPNIVTVIDAERVGDEVVMVLEHVSGGSLADRLEQGPLTPDQLDRLTDDLLAGLQAAHEAGVVHRDVKPANILLTATGSAKLADFGIARSDGTGTVTGASLGDDAAGTVAYMAPEQARGQAPDRRADLYALGAVLYEAATGQPYLDLSGLVEFEARLAILDREPRLPVDELSPALNDALAACLAKDPGLRPQTVDELRALLAPENEASEAVAR